MGRESIEPELGLLSSEIQSVFNQAIDKKGERGALVNDG